MLRGLAAADRTMSKYAQKVFSDPLDIAALEALVAQLPDSLRVSIVEHDGTTTTGIVGVVPSVQVFRDADENEGVNAMVRIEDPDLPEGFRTIWLDRIKRVVHHDPVVGSPKS
jgi:hypothetical protein